MDGKVDVFVSSMGTGGTISGTGRYLKEQDSSVKVVGADPIGSLYYDYFKTGKLTEAHSYKVEGFGEDFLPTTMHFDYVDEVVRVSDKECFDMTRRLVREEGIYTGGSSGGALVAAIKYAEHVDKPMRIVVIMCDSASRYLSKIFNDDWMREHGFLGQEAEVGTVADLLAAKNTGDVITATPKTSIREVVATMKEHGFSQLPVVEGGRVLGVISETDMLTCLLNPEADATRSIEDLVTSDFAIVEPSNGLSLVSQFFSQKKIVMVVDQGQLVGIITKIDFIDYVSDAS
jgi:cystathionine beta-synthase